MKKLIVLLFAVFFSFISIRVSAEWVKDVTSLTIPNTIVQGKLNGKNFICEKAKLDQFVGTLELSQGKDFFPDLGLLIFLFPKKGESFENKKYIITPDKSMAPHVYIKYKVQGKTTPEQKIYMSKYSMRLEFGKINDGNLSGKIYIALPDENKSYAAGTFIVKTNKNLGANTTGTQTVDKVKKTSVKTEKLQEYYVYMNGRTLGPMSAWNATKLKGFSLKETLVAKVGSRNWVYAETIKEFHNPVKPAVTKKIQPKPIVAQTNNVSNNISVRKTTPQKYPNQQFNKKMGLAIAGSFLAIFIAIFVLIYVYFALSLFIIARKTNTDAAILAWIPIVQIVLLILIAKRPIWWIILLFIPLVNFIVGIILWMDVAKERGKPGWVGLLILVPLVGFFIPGYLAFSE